MRLLVENLDLPDFQYPLKYIRSSIRKTKKKETFQTVKTIQLFRFPFLSLHVFDTIKFKLLNYSNK